MRNDAAEQEFREPHAAHAANGLSGDVEQCVPRFDFSQTQEGQRERGIHVRAGLLAPRRINDPNSGHAHREPVQREA